MNLTSIPSFSGFPLVHNFVKKPPIEYPNLQACACCAHGKCLIDQGKFREAKELFEEAISKDSNFVMAQTYLDFCNERLGLSDQSTTKKCDAVAQFYIGVMFNTGQGVEKSYEQAARRFGLAADLGLAGAQFNLAVLYAKGQGVHLSDEQALYWFEQAANQGDREAQYYLGSMHLNGRAAIPSDEKAFVWFKKAADLGHLIAQYNEGVMYHEGIGVKQSYKKALYWLNKADDQKFQPAKNFLDTIPKGGPTLIQKKQSIERAIERWSGSE